MTRLISATWAVVRLLWLVTCIAFSFPFFVVAYVYGIAYRGARSGFRAAQDL